jgi:hypothetical protein
MTQPLTITIDGNTAAAYLRQYAVIVGALAQDRSKRARLAGHATAAHKALCYLLTSGGYRIVAPGVYEFDSQSGDPDGPWRADENGCDCKGAYGRGYCFHTYARAIALPYDRELARAAERMAQQQAPRRASRVCVGQHLTDQSDGAVYRSVTMRAPETVAVAPNTGTVTRETAAAEVAELFAD